MSKLALLAAGLIAVSGAAFANEPATAPATTETKVDCVALKDSKKAEDIKTYKEKCEVKKEEKK